ncbi:MAG TPA: Smr/MutS family protein [Thermoanaerobaculaceae bacterium]|nr:Smr/MutS family protein [Thermoanaerobaculaceae bacterium]
MLKLVATFARSERGRHAVITTLPRFSPGEGSKSFSLTNELLALITKTGTLSFTGLDAVHLLEDGIASPADGSELARLVALVRRIVEVRAALLADAPGPELGRVLSALPQFEALLAFCERRLGPGGEVLDSASPALAQARAARERHRVAIVAAVEQVRRQNKNLSAPFTVRRERYCIPVPANERASVPGLVLDISSSGATVFLEPFAVVDLNNALAEATALARSEEERVLAELASSFHRHRDDLVGAATALATLDAYQARVLFGQACEGRLLQPGTGDSLCLCEARHPLLDPALAPLRAQALGEPGNSRPIVPLDLEFPEGAKLVLLSGPNAGGKTVALKTVGLAALMAQTGIPVLAEEGSALPPFNRLWCHLGDEQNLFSDLSTFTGAMRATASLLAEADADTLVLYDELGSGTDPEEGAALAAALIEELARRGCWTVATAHLITVAAHMESVPGAVNAAMGYDEESGRPTYRLHLGVPGRSRGLAIASSWGVPPGVVARARQLLSKAFLAIDAYLGALQEERERLRREREELAARTRDTEEARRHSEAERERLAREQERVRLRLAEERDALRRRAKEQLASALSELEEARARGEFPGKRKVAAIRRSALAFAPEDAPPETPEPFAVGATVRVLGTAAVGVVGRVIGDRVEVQVGDKRMWVERVACQPVEPAPAQPRAAIEVPSVETTIPAELKLIGRTKEEAREELERFLDRAALAGVSHVRVVHGHGTGALRKVVREVLSSHPAVARFTHPPQHRGGTGVTEAELDSR